jgi:hypothetical protein
MPAGAGEYEASQEAPPALWVDLGAGQPDLLLVAGYDDGACFNAVKVPQFCTNTAMRSGDRFATVAGDPPR